MLQPTLLARAWAAAGLKNTIPDVRTDGLAQGSATYDEGFPSITMTPISQGGKAPSGKDMNGILYAISHHIVHINKGGTYKFDVSFAGKINGYDKGAILLNDAENALFISLVNQNKHNFNKSSDYSQYWAVLASTESIKQTKPKKITGSSRNAADVTGHTHEIEKASIEQEGIVQLSSETDSTSEDKAATPKAIKVLKDLISAVTRSLSNYIPNSKKSNAVDSSSSDTIATSFAAKTAYDKGVEAKATADTAIAKNQELDTKLHDVSLDLQDFVNLCLDPTLLNPKLGFTWRAGPTGGESIGGRTVRVISDRDNVYSRKIKVKAGDRFYLSYQYLRKQGSAPIAIGLVLDWDKSSRRTLKPSDATSTNLVGGVTKIDCYVDVPEGYDYAQLWLQIDQYNTNATQYYIDNVEWRRVSGSVVSVLTGEITHGGTIPLPAGFAQEQCKWHLSPSKVYDRGGGDINNFVFSADGNRLVTAHTEGGAHPSNRASYIIIGIK